MSNTRHAPGNLTMSIKALLGYELGISRTKKRRHQIHVLRSGLSWLMNTEWREPGRYWEDLPENFKKLKSWQLNHSHLVSGSKGQIFYLKDLIKFANAGGGFKKSLAPWKHIPDFGQGSLDLLVELLEKVQKVRPL
jgi:hypothetical protein